MSPNAHEDAPVCGKVFLKDITCIRRPHHQGPHVDEGSEHSWWFGYLLRDGEWTHAK